MQGKPQQARFLDQLDPIGGQGANNSNKMARNLGRPDT
jgi:hypothetical protein